MSTYAQNLLKRRLANKQGWNPERGQPIPGERTEAAIARKQRSRMQRLTRSQRQAEAANRRKEAQQQIEKSLGKVS